MITLEAPLVFIEAICGKEGTDLFSTEHPSSWLNEHGVQFRVGPLVAATEDPQVATPPNETQYPQTTDAPVAAGITLDEVALHNTPQDIWVALYGNVYDLTLWATIHEGGPEHIIDLAGTDGTAMFAKEHNKIKNLRFVEVFRLGPLVP
jgi:nitrate reductase (NAD(P)H)